MLKVYSKNEKELAMLLGNMKGCQVIVEGENKESYTPVTIEGTCSACPHFTSRNTEEMRAGRVKWGFCNKLKANINETHKYCSQYENERKEVAVEEQEVKRVYVA